MNEQNQFEQLLASLRRQEQLLTDILKSLNTKRQGFGDAAITNYIYCNRHNNCLWYQMDRGSNIHPIDAKNFTGYLKELKFQEVTRRNKLVWKLMTTFEANGSLYIFESGYDSHFSKGLLASVATMTYEQLTQLIT
ncbi:MAG: hypothetical protein ICV78_26530, partial [Tolypothrix sp. Co-bin9]|nr:hypothetical protein [Tolypothrix sp. Co-bin9]